MAKRSKKPIIGTVKYVFEHKHIDLNPRPSKPEKPKPPVEIRPRYVNADGTPAREPRKKARIVAKPVPHDYRTGMGSGVPSFEVRYLCSQCGQDGFADPRAQTTTGKVVCPACGGTMKAT